MSENPRKSCIIIKPVAGNSESHNLRIDEPKYLVDPCGENINLVSAKIAERRAEIEAKYLKSRGQKLPKTATPIREAVLLLPDNNNDRNLESIANLTEALEAEFGIRAMQIHIHNDEGFQNEETGEIKYNYHAHIVFDWTNPKTGKAVRLNKKDMSRMQDITQKLMEGMAEREKGSKKTHLNHRQYKVFMEMKTRLIKELNRKLTQEEEKELRYNAKYEKDGRKQTESREAKNNGRNVGTEKTEQKSKGRGI